MRAFRKNDPNTTSGTETESGGSSNSATDFGSYADAQSKIEGTTEPETKSALDLAKEGQYHLHYHASHAANQQLQDITFRQIDEAFRAASDQLEGGATLSNEQRVSIAARAMAGAGLDYPTIAINIGKLFYDSEHAVDSVLIADGSGVKLTLADGTSCSFPQFEAYEGKNTQDFEAQNDYADLERYKSHLVQGYIRSVKAEMQPSMASRKEDGMSGTDILLYALQEVAAMELGTFGESTDPGDMSVEDQAAITMLMRDLGFTKVQIDLDDWRGSTAE